MYYILTKKLIVAKCIVNFDSCRFGTSFFLVLIVAKCIVNSTKFSHESGTEAY